MQCMKLQQCNISAITKKRCSLFFAVLPCSFSAGRVVWQCKKKPPRCIILFPVGLLVCCPPTPQNTWWVGRWAEVHACSKVGAAVPVNLSDFCCSGLQAEPTGFSTSMERQENRNGGTNPRFMHCIK